MNPKVSHLKPDHSKQRTRAIRNVGVTRSADGSVQNFDVLPFVIANTEGTGECSSRRAGGRDLQRINRHDDLDPGKLVRRIASGFVATTAVGNPSWIDRTHAASQS